MSSLLNSDRPSYHRSSRSEQPIRSNYEATDEPSTFETDPTTDTSPNSNSTENLLSTSSSVASASTRRSRQESISSYLSSIDLQYPALVSLRDALLGYLGEAEDIVLERIRGRDGEVEHENDHDTDWSSYGPHLDAAMDSGIEGADTTSTSTSTSSASSNLRNRTHLLRRRLSNTLPALPTRHIPSPEALLAHLSAIREDVVASLPAIPRRLGNIGLPSLPSRASLVALGDVSGLLQGLPQRLGVLNEHLPGLVIYPYTQGLGAGSNWEGLDEAGNVDLGDERASSPPPVTPDGLASRLSAENRKRIMGVVKSLLPSEDWPGWERLGWEDYDEDEDEEEFGSSRSAAGLGLGLGFRGPGSSSRPGGIMVTRRSQSYKQPSTLADDETEWQSSARRQTNSSGSSPTSIIKRLLIHPSRSEPHGLHPNSPDVEVEEEPEYLFPNKTPAAAMRRQQSYAVKREARELRRARSVSLSALGEKGVEGLGGGMDVRRVKSRDERARSTVDLVFSDTDDEGRAGGSVVDELGKDAEDEDDEEEDDMDVEIDAVPVLDIGPTVHTALAKSGNGTKLILFDDVPWWMRNNEYVISGYRCVLEAIHNLSSSRTNTLEAPTLT